MQNLHICYNVYTTCRELLLIHPLFNGPFEDASVGILKRCFVWVNQIMELPSGEKCDEEEEKRRKVENVAIIAMYCHLRPPDAIAFPT